jgi:hypothetical protein
MLDVLRVIGALAIAYLFVMEHRYFSRPLRKVGAPGGVIVAWERVVITVGWLIVIGVVVAVVYRLV